MIKLDKWTTLGASALVVGALLACKKKEAPPPPIESAAPAPEPPKEEPKKEEPKKDEVKRYGSKETEEKGTVKVIFFSAKVYNEADDSVDHVATLSRGTLVNRKARMGNWTLIEYPSGVGELSPGWMLSKRLSTIVLKIDIEKVKTQDAGVVIVDAGKPKVIDAGKKPVDAGKKVVDAGKKVVDAGKKVVDAGKKPTKGRLKLPFKLPGKK